VATGWFSRRAIALHLTLAVVVPTFALLCRWQVERALAGNDLSWAYVFEWPFFAGYAVYLWWRLLHDEDGPLVRRGPETAQGPAGTDPAQTDPFEADPVGSDDGALASYNEYLAKLHASDPPKRW
jgi:DNA-binding transcriptional regulator of glucitol operon